MAETADVTRYRLYIGGEEVDSATGETFEALNPTTGRPWATHARAGAEDVDRAVRAARRAFEDEAWRGLSPTRRGRLMMRLADLIAERAEEAVAACVRTRGAVEPVTAWIEPYRELRERYRALYPALRAASGA